MDVSLFRFAKQGELRPVEPGDFVQIDQEPHFIGTVKAANSGAVLVDCVAGLFMAPFDEISILGRAA